MKIFLQINKRSEKRKAPKKRTWVETTFELKNGIPIKKIKSNEANWATNLLKTIFNIKKSEKSEIIIAKRLIIFEKNNGDKLNLNKISYSNAVPIETSWGISLS